MVLQDRYAKAASRRYQRTHDPTPEQAAESAAVDAALREAERRRLGTNADRYKEDDDELQKALGAAAGLPKEGDDEVDEEEELRKAEEKAELDAFLQQQREKLASPSASTATADEEDDEDVDHTFAHLRIGGRGKMVRPTGRGRVETEEEKAELLKMQDEARRMQAVRDLKDRFSGTAPRHPPPLAPARSAAPAANASKPSKPIIQPAKKGQDFLDALL
ncbi:uncharacterized protein JCM10292_002646 [Rhodotorula paludigena]|uniref:uncharacterized protein n=1 Tax=Rhodotorula paludigena TaxID=86838 RepID=UPI00316DD2FD